MFVTWVINHSSGKTLEATVETFSWLFYNKGFLSRRSQLNSMTKSIYPTRDCCFQCWLFLSTLASQNRKRNDVYIRSIFASCFSGNDLDSFLWQLCYVLLREQHKKIVSTCSETSFFCSSNSRRDNGVVNLTMTFMYRWPLYDSFVWWFIFSMQRPFILYVRMEQIEQINSQFIYFSPIKS